MVVAVFRAFQDEDDALSMMLKAWLPEGRLENNARDLCNIGVQIPSRRKTSPSVHIPRKRISFLIGIPLDDRRRFRVLSGKDGREVLTSAADQKLNLFCPVKNLPTKLRPSHDLGGDILALNGTLLFRRFFGFHAREYASRACSVAVIMGRQPNGLQLLKARKPPLQRGCNPELFYDFLSPSYITGARGHLWSLVFERIHLLCKTPPYFFQGKAGVDIFHKRPNRTGRDMAKPGRRSRNLVPDDVVRFLALSGYRTEHTEKPFSHAQGLVSTIHRIRAKQIHRLCCRLCAVHLDRPA